MTTTSTGITVTMDGTQVLSYATPTCRPMCSSGSRGGPEASTTSTRSRTCSSRPRRTAAGAHRDRRQPDVGTEHGRDSRSPSPAPDSPAPGRRAAVDFGPNNPADTYAVTSPTHHHRHRPAGQRVPSTSPSPTAGGTSATSAADQYTYIVPPVPTVTNVSPTSGPVTGGTTVTITGTGFT